jgi:hypothetical protein
MIAVSRDGEPELKLGPFSGSLKRPSEYWISTTPVPPGDDGVVWLGVFNSLLGSQPPFAGYHDGSKIIVECWPDDEPKLVETVDADIEHANKRLLELRG